MAEVARTSMFGPNSRETLEDLIISKADMAKKGLVPAAVNTSESMLLCIILTAKDELTEARQANNPEQNTTITEPFNSDSFVTRNSQSYRQKALALNLQELDEGFSFDPMKF